MRSRTILEMFMAAWICHGAAGEVFSVESPASGPVKTSLTLYDRGVAMVQELRRATLAAGENTVTFTALPASLDPSSVSILPASGPSGIKTIDHLFAYDLSGAASLFDRYRGKMVNVSRADREFPGVLLDASGFSEKNSSHPKPLTIRTDDDLAMAFFSPEHLDYISFPAAGATAFLEPTLVWRVDSRQEGPQNLRLTYFSDQINWGMAYDCFLSKDGSKARLEGRAVLDNRSGVDYKAASVKLVITEKGQMTGLVPAAGDSPIIPLRYAYAQETPSFERSAASAGVVDTFNLDETVDLAHRQTRHVRVVSAEEVPVSRFYVYDGVRFDKFQRNRRNDWNYGTEFHRIVQTHVEFDNPIGGAIGRDLPPGRFRLYAEAEGGEPDLISEDQFAGAAIGAKGSLVIGPARGLVGERERTGYAEVKPLHEYDETFEIRLSNLSEQDVEVRVVEHLYRWQDFEIVKADAEYQQTAPQTIEFRLLLKTGGKRTVHYTVRYSW